MNLMQGRVISAGDGRVVINPVGTGYQLELEASGEWPVGQRVCGAVRAKARKVWTISAGGGFISPMVGTPRVVQGRVRRVETGRIVVQAGAEVGVELPPGPEALDLVNGPIAPGVMVNITLEPGASFEAA